MPVKRPYYPIIYVRGYAMTQGEIADTVATPYMGFNLGSTKVRQSWDGAVVRHIFESPLVRLMKDYEYIDIYHGGVERAGRVSARSIVVYRYYEPADVDLGSGQVPTIEEAAIGLRQLIRRLRDQVCGEDEAERARFKVYLLAHSMGGLVCRCFLQNDRVSQPADRDLVDKVFTYATPHNGIEMAGFNVPSFMSKWSLDNFNREKMAGYLGLPAHAGRVHSLNGKFDAKRFFCLVGTNHKDYEVAFGLSSKLAGEMSDGLVKISNATVEGAPRAFVHRAHSGPYGIVNSEEGYQNLSRFLFGDLQVNGVLEVEDLPLPPSVQKAYKAGTPIRASYYFESTVAPRGAGSYALTERRKETHSAILRTFDEMFRLDAANVAEPRWPTLFSVFLDTDRVEKGSTVVFAVDLSVSATGYEIDEGRWILNPEIPGEYLFRDTLVIRARQGKDGWTIRYNPTSEAWGESRGREAAEDDAGFFIPLTTRKGFKGSLRLKAGGWQ